jgi:hypothetical protein
VSSLGGAAVLGATDDGEPPLVLVSPRFIEPDDDWPEVCANAVALAVPNKEIRIASVSFFMVSPEQKPFLSKKTKQ